MQVWPETISRALYVQARGSLWRELTRHLRTGGEERFARARSSRGPCPGGIAGMVMVSERPPEVSGRAVPGRWEGDWLIGTRGRAIATLFERQTRYCRLVALLDGTNAEPVCEALQASITTLPAQLRRSLTCRPGRTSATSTSETLLLVAAIVAVALILIPILFSGIELIIVGTLLAAGVMARSLLRKPWVVQAKSSDSLTSGPLLEWRVRGWRAVRQTDRTNCLGLVRWARAARRWPAGMID
jgi:hypothetical protein